MTELDEVRTGLAEEERMADGNAFPGLRTAQKEALLLPGWKTSFLWGPLGTGKTFTLGHVLAARRKPRVLLLSTTSTAVDLVLGTVNEVLTRLEGGRGRLAARYRFGSRFAPKH